ncbi:methyltransferase domain-containing protein [Rhodobacterales bacterium FZCC0069]|nr:methyltransferase domain-containing protein [Rhodobacterales bacterium FZCC0069]
MDLNKMYGDEYFEKRYFNDPKRLASFMDEKKFIEKYHDLTGTICDVGCSTGEFLKAIEWRGIKYGMEINESAIKIAQSNSISFEKNILTERDFFDVIVFRGTIQHLINPFEYIAASHKSLKPGGFIVFLATPNINCIFYKLFNSLPALDQNKNFYLPSDTNLCHILNILSFKTLEVQKPYLGSPYSNLLMDHAKFISRLALGSRRFNKSFAFWGNMMNIIAKKV